MGQYNFSGNVEIEDTEDFKNLAIFMCKTWTDIEAWRGELMKAKTLEEMKDIMIMKYPMIQGTQNQFNLEKVGQLGFDSGRIARAVKKLIED